VKRRQPASEPCRAHSSSARAPPPSSNTTAARKAGAAWRTIAALRSRSGFRITPSHRVHRADAGANAGRRHRRRQAPVAVPPRGRCRGVACGCWSSKRGRRSTRSRTTGSAPTTGNSTRFPRSRVAGQVRVRRDATARAAVAAPAFVEPAARADGRRRTARRARIPPRAWRRRHDAALHRRGASPAPAGDEDAQRLRRGGRLAARLRRTRALLLRGGKGRRCGRAGGRPLAPAQRALSVTRAPPELRQPAAARRLPQAGAELGSNSLAALSEPYDGRPACNHCGNCNRGCPLTDKGSADVTFLRQARATGTAASGRSVT